MKGMELLNFILFDSTNYIIMLEVNYILRLEAIRRRLRIFNPSLIVIFLDLLKIPKKLEFFESISLGKQMLLFEINFRLTYYYPNSMIYF